MPPIVQTNIADPTFLQSKTYNAVDDRKVAQDVFGAGPIGASDFVVSYNSGRTLDISAGVGYIKGLNIADQGSYRVRTSGTTQITGSVGDGSNPRIDQVVLIVLDSTHDTSGQQKAVAAIAEGTPTSGATLVNRSGVADLTNLAIGSKSVIHLADLLVPAAATVYAGANLADKRVFASLTFPGRINVAGSGSGEGIRMGNDASLWDVDNANSMQLRGIQNPDRGVMTFGNTSAVQIGYDGTDYFVRLSDAEIKRVAANVLGQGAGDLLLGNLCCAMMSSDAISVASTLTRSKLDMETTDFALGVTADLSNNRLTALYQGKYLIFGSVIWAANSTNVRVQALRRNNTIDLSIDSMAAVNGDLSGLSSWALVDMEVSDYVELFVAQNCGSSLSAQGFNRLAMIRVGEGD